MYNGVDNNHFLVRFVQANNGLKNTVGKDVEMVVRKAERLGDG